MGTLIISGVEILSVGSKFEQGQLFKDKGVPMVLKNLEWEFDLENYDFKTYEDPNSDDYKIIWRHRCNTTSKETPTT